MSVSAVLHCTALRCNVSKGMSTSSLQKDLFERTFLYLLHVAMIDISFSLPVTTLFTFLSPSSPPDSSISLNVAIVAPHFTPSNVPLFLLLPPPSFLFLIPLPLLPTTECLSEGDRVVPFRNREQGRVCASVWQ